MKMGITNLDVNFIGYWKDVEEFIEEKEVELGVELTDYSEITINYRNNLSYLQVYPVQKDYHDNVIVITMTGYAVDNNRHDDLPDVIEQD